ncbi:MAG: sulfite oxidase heme-binding subunit YedZ [Gemmatimonadaceae bacterium]
MARLPTKILLRRSAKVVVFVMSLLPLAYLAYGLYADALGANPVEAVEQGTGKWTLRFLIFTLMITPLRRTTGWNELIKYRRMIGLFAFFYATVHLLIYFSLDVGFSLGDVVHDVIKHPYITMGMLAWLTLVPLAITSTRGWVRRLGGKRWARLHRLIYATAIAASIHFLWAVKKDVSEPLVYIAIFAVLLAYRLWVAAPRLVSPKPERTRGS